MTVVLNIKQVRAARRARERLRRSGVDVRFVSPFAGPRHGPDRYQPTVAEVSLGARPPCWYCGGSGTRCCEFGRDA